jgi:hypothetical protein
MSAPKYVLLVWFAFSILLGVARIGKPVNATTPGSAVVMLGITATLAWLVVIA